MEVPASWPISFALGVVSSVVATAIVAVWKLRALSVWLARAVLVLETRRSKFDGSDEQNKVVRDTWIISLVDLASRDEAKVSVALEGLIHVAPMLGTYERRTAYEAVRVAYYANPYRSLDPRFSSVVHTLDKLGAT